MWSKRSCNIWLLGSHNIAKIWWLSEEVCFLEQKSGSTLSPWAIVWYEDNCWLLFILSCSPTSPAQHFRFFLFFASVITGGCPPCLSYVDQAPPESRWGRWFFTTFCPKIRASFTCKVTATPRNNTGFKQKLLKALLSFLWEGRWRGHTLPMRSSHFN